MQDLLFSSQKQFPSFTLHFYGTMNCLPSWECVNESFPGCLIHFILKGKGEFLSNGLRHTLGAGSGFIIPSAQKRYYIADSDDPWQYVWICISGGLLSAFNKQYSKDTFRFDPSKTAPLLQELLLYIPESKAADELFYTGIVSSLLHRICAGDSQPFEEQSDAREEGIPTDSESPYATASLRNQYIEKSVGYIQSHYMEDIRIGELAKNIGLERSYFTKIFISKMGMSPYAFLMEERLKNAKLLLKYSIFSLAQIAEATGFKNVRNLKIMLKKSAYRDGGDK